MKKILLPIITLGFLIGLALIIWFNPGGWGEFLADLGAGLGLLFLFTLIIYGALFGIFRLIQGPKSAMVNKPTYRTLLFLIANLVSLPLLGMVLSRPIDIYDFLLALVLIIAFHSLQNPVGRFIGKVFKIAPESAPEPWTYMKQSSSDENPRQKSGDSESEAELSSEQIAELKSSSEPATEIAFREDMNREPATAVDTSRHPRPESGTAETRQGPDLDAMDDGALFKHLIELTGNDLDHARKLVMTEMQANPGSKNYRVYLLAAIMHLHGGDSE